MKWDRLNQVICFTCCRVDLQQIESTGYELIREGMKVLEEEVGKTCNRETIAKSKLTKLMTITSEDFELNTEIIGTSQLMNSGDFFTLGKTSLIFRDASVAYV